MLAFRLSKLCSFLERTLSLSSIGLCADVWIRLRWSREYPISYIHLFGAAFKLGRHEWFALRRLITNSRSSAFTRGFLKLFFLETSQEDGRIKNWTMKKQLHGILRLKNSPTGEQIQKRRQTDEMTRDPITPWCGPPLFCSCLSLAETSVLNIS